MMALNTGKSSIRIKIILILMLLIIFSLVNIVYIDIMYGNKKIDYAGCSEVKDTLTCSIKELSIHNIYESIIKKKYIYSRSEKIDNISDVVFIKILTAKKISCLREGIYSRDYVPILYFKDWAKFNMISLRLNQSEININSELGLSCQDGNLIIKYNNLSYQNLAYYKNNLKPTSVSIEYYSQAVLLIFQFLIIYTLVTNKKYRIWILIGSIVFFEIIYFLVISRTILMNVELLKISTLIFYQLLLLALLIQIVHWRNLGNNVWNEFKRISKNTSQKLNCPNF